MHRKKTAGLLILLLVVILIGAPGWLTYRQVRQDRLDKALIAAMECDDTPAALSLLSQGADADARDEPNVKPLSLWHLLLDSLRGRHRPPSTAPTALLTWLEARAASLGGDDLRTPEENTSLVKALLAHGASVNVEDSYDRTPLILATHWGHTATVQLLLAHGADVNKPDAGGQTPLMIATIQPDSLPCLLNYGAKINLQDDDGWTALMYAVETGQLKAVRLLLDRGADVHVKGKDGHTALSLAKRSDYPAILVPLLKQAGAKE